MNSVLCEKGVHYYDADAYDACPHCAKEQEEGRKEEGQGQAGGFLAGAGEKAYKKGHPRKEERKEKSGLGSWFKKNKTAGRQLHEMGQAAGSFTGKPPEQAPEGLPGRWPEQAPEGQAGKPPRQAPKDPAERQPDRKTVSLKDGHTPHTKAMKAEESLTSIISGIQGNEPKTMGFWGVQSMEPIVGWLVCVKGPEQGEYYPLRAGKNTVGRTVDMDICISQDGAISRRHTVIKYEPRSRKVKILPNEGDGIVYRGEEDFDVPTELCDRDILAMGKSQFVLVMLCGPQFTWDDWLKQE